VAGVSTADELAKLQQLKDAGTIYKMILGRSRTLWTGAVAAILNADDSRGAQAPRRSRLGWGPLAVVSSK